MGAHERSATASRLCRFYMYSFQRTALNYSSRFVWTLQSPSDAVPSRTGRKKEQNRNT